VLGAALKSRPVGRHIHHEDRVPVDDQDAVEEFAADGAGDAFGMALARRST